ncbi:hypothetical protein TPA0906_73470 [Streptomyces olivaceus]|nr:hypothetical protein TPA0906_73470 [Streptomyces olivaceus]
MRGNVLEADPHVESLRSGPHSAPGARGPVSRSGRTPSLWAEFTTLYSPSPGTDKRNERPLGGILGSLTSSSHGGTTRPWPGTSATAAPTVVLLATGPPAAMEHSHLVTPRTGPYSDGHHTGLSRSAQDRAEPPARREWSQ